MPFQLPVLAVIDDGAGQPLKALEKAALRRRAVDLARPNARPWPKRPLSLADGRELLKRFRRAGVAPVDGGRP